MRRAHDSICVRWGRGSRLRTVASLNLLSKAFSPSSSHSLIPLFLPLNVPIFLQRDLSTWRRVARFRPKKANFYLFWKKETIQIIDCSKRTLGLLVAGRDSVLRLLYYQGGEGTRDRTIRCVYLYISDTRRQQPDGKRIHLNRVWHYYYVSFPRLIIFSALRNDLYLLSPEPI